MLKTITLENGVCGGEGGMVCVCEREKESGTFKHTRVQMKERHVHSGAHDWRASDATAEEVPPPQ